MIQDTEQDLRDRIRQLEEFVERARELLFETVHRIPDKQVIIHDLVKRWQMDLRAYIKGQRNNDDERKQDSASDSGNRASDF